MLWDESGSIMGLLHSRIQREQDKILKRFLDEKQDAAELRGEYLGLEVARQTVRTILDELDEEKK